MGTRIRINQLFIEMYYILLRSDLIPKGFDDGLIFTVLDYLPRRVNDHKQHTVLLEDYNFKYANKGRSVQTLEAIALLESI